MKLFEVDDEVEDEVDDEVAFSAFCEAVSHAERNRDANIADVIIILFFI